MAEGANRKFIKERERFLRENIIEVKVTFDKLIEVATKHADPQKAVLAQKGRIANRDVDATLAAKVKSGVYDFDLFKTGRTGTVTGAAGKRASSVPIFELKEWGQKVRDQVIVPKAGGTFDVRYETPGKARPVRAYWAPWSSGSCWSVQLGDDADFFFTPTMDGCSLAISSGAAPIVTHGNYKSLTDPTAADEARTLRELGTHHTTTHGTDVAKTLAKNTYAASHTEKVAGVNKLVTVVGFRDPTARRWSFFWQRRRVDAANPQVGVVLEDRLVPL